MITKSRIKKSDRPSIHHHVAVGLSALAVTALLAFGDVAHAMAGHAFACSVVASENNDIEAVEAVEAVDAVEPKAPLEIKAIIVEGLLEIEAAGEINVVGEVALGEAVVFEVNMGLGREEADQNQDPEATDDDDLEQAPVVQQPRFNVNEEQFDQWVFNQVGNAQKATERFQAALNMQVDSIAAACDISPEQKEKLLLAGRGDIIRFFDKVEVSRAKFKKVKNDQNRINEVFQDILPLQLAASAGLFDDNSFFQKVVKKTLTEEQRAKSDQITKERVQFQYKAKVELIVAALDDTIAMRADQRKALTEMLLAAPPPKRFGPYDSYLFLYRISRLPEDQVKKLFDPPQWRALDRQLDQARNLQPFLKQQGLLTDDDVEP